MFALSIFITFGLQFYVPIKITWPFFSKRLSSRRFQIYSEYIYRTILVLVSCEYAYRYKTFEPGLWV